MNGMNAAAVFFATVLFAHHTQVNATQQPTHGCGGLIGEAGAVVDTGRLPPEAVCMWYIPYPVNLFQGMVVDFHNVTLERESLHFHVRSFNSHNEVRTIVAGPGHTHKWFRTIGDVLIWFAGDSQPSNAIRFKVYKGGDAPYKPEDWNHICGSYIKNRASLWIDCRSDQWATYVIDGLHQESLTTFTHLSYLPPGSFVTYARLDYGQQYITWIRNQLDLNLSFIGWPLAFIVVRIPPNAKVLVHIDVQFRNRSGLRLASPSMGNETMPTPIRQPHL